MTKHAYNKLCAHTRSPWKRAIAMRRRRAWLAKQHRRQIAIALAKKERERCAAS